MSGTEPFSPNAICIRCATAADRAAIASFNCAMAHETEDKALPLPVVSAGVERLLKNPQFGFYLVADQEGEVIGSLMITYEWSDWHDGVYWWIQSVYVKPEFRGRGIFRRLHERVRELAAGDPDFRALRLYVEENNLAAQETYQRLGMKDAGYKVFQQMPESHAAPGITQINP